MAKKLFTDLLEDAKARTATIRVGEHEIKKEDFDKNVKVLLSLMSTDGSSRGLPQINMKEALGTADASILLPKVIDQALLVKPIEPEMIASTKLAKIINVDAGVQSVVFPTLGAIKAAEIGETQDYPQATPAFTEFTTEVRVSKFGVMIPVSEQVINYSMWDVLALFVEAGRYAMARLKEERCFNELFDRSHVVFDNDITGNTSALTTGTDASGAANGTVSWMDLVDAISVILGNEFTPTDMCVHPLLWSAFAKDPILNYQVLQSGNTGQFFQNVGPESMNDTIPVPFALNISPFIGYNASDTVLGYTGPSTNIHILDRNKSLVLLVQEGLSSDEFTDPFRDIRFVKIKERYGTGVLNAGKASVVLKNVRVAVNNAPLYTIKTV